MIGNSVIASQNAARLVLLRHGETAHNLAMRLTGWGDPPLNATGVAQAENAAAAILARYGRTHIGALYASPLRRTIQTAQPLVAATAHAPIYYPDLRELFFGLCEGLTPEEIIARFPESLERARVADDNYFAWPEGETRAAFYGRINHAVRDIVRQERRPVADVRGETPERVAVVVAHGGVIGAVLAELAHAASHRWREFLPQNAAFADVIIYDEPTQGGTLHGEIISTGPLVPLPDADTDRRSLLDRPPRPS